MWQQLQLFRNRFLKACSLSISPFAAFPAVGLLPKEQDRDSCCLSTSMFNLTEKDNNKSMRNFNRRIRETAEHGILPQEGEEQGERQISTTTLPESSVLEQARQISRPELFPKRKLLRMRKSTARSTSGLKKSEEGSLVMVCNRQSGFGVQDDRKGNESLIVTSRKQPPKQSKQGEKPFKCTRCNYASSRKSDLQVHFRTHTKENPFECTKCNYASSRNDHLERHVRTHTGEKPYECKLCSQAFSQSSTLKVHLRTHTGEKPYKCNLCSQSFSDSSKLKKHARTHTGEKPYECKLCSQAFSQSSNLNVHLRTHTGEKPFKCTRCNFASSIKSDLQKHLRTHTGEKPYKCKLCSQAFSESSNLKKHARTHTGDKPYACTSCGRAFSRRFSLTRHQRRPHCTARVFSLL